jgi:hypothetical protein
MDIKKLVKEVDILPAAGAPETCGKYAGKSREFEFLGYASLLDGTPLSPYTLRKVEREDWTVGNVVGFLNLYSQEKSKYAMLMPFQAAMAAFTESRHCPEITNQVKGTKLITNMAVLRGGNKTKLGFRPLIEDGKITKFLDGEAVAEEDLSGSVAYLDENYWAASHDNSKPQTYVAGDVYFHPSIIGGVRLSEALVSVVFEKDDSLHIFSNIALDDQDTTVRFPMVRMRTLKI